MNLWKLQQMLQGVGEELRNETNNLTEMYSNGSSTLEQRNSQKTKVEDLKERFEGIKAKVEEEERSASEKLKTQKNENMNDEQRKISAKAEFIRASLVGGQVSDEVRNLLGAIKAPHASGGEKLLPVNMATELVHEPFAKNPLRGNSVTTGIKGLVLPKIAFSLDDDDFITDEQTAKELKLEGDQVVFGRHKFKVKAKISDTVVHGTDTNLTTFVDNALQSGLAAKEKKVAFTLTPKSGEENMSFYKAGIKEVEAANKYKAIKSAIADLHEDFRENAKVCMRYADYLDIIETLANGSTTLYGAQPEQVLGKKAIFCDDAIDPVVGDFNYSHYNYDGEIVYDSDKDVDKGEYLFVLTGWFDHKIKLKSAFRIAKEKVTP